MTNEVVEVHRFVRKFIICFSLQSRADRGLNRMITNYTSTN